MDGVAATWTLWAFFHGFIGGVIRLWVKKGCPKNHGFVTGKIDPAICGPQGWHLFDPYPIRFRAMSCSPQVVEDKIEVSSACESTVRCDRILTPEEAETKAKVARETWKKHPNTTK